MKQKIRKTKDTASFWSIMTLKEKLLLFSVFIICIALVSGAFLFYIYTHDSGPNSRSSREVLMSTAGTWDTFENYGIDVWMPKDLTKETYENELDTYNLIYAKRDKGNYPERALGVISIPETNGSIMDLDIDSELVHSTATPYITEALAEMFNGLRPSMSVECDYVTLENGEKALVAEGTAFVTVVFRDPKDPENPYTEEVTTNLYYMISVFYGRPVVVWSTWDYSEYMGEEDSKAGVMDAMLSLVENKKIPVVVPEVDDYDATSQDMVEVENKIVYYDEEQKAWMNESGEILEDMTSTDPTHKNDTSE